MSIRPGHIAPVPAGDPADSSTNALRGVSIPAIIFVSPDSAALRIAALTLLDRLVVAVHRAGASPIAVVSADPLPGLKRARALSIPFTTSSNSPRLRGPTLIASTDLLVQPADIRACIETSSRLLSKSGEALPLGVVESFQSSVEATVAGRPALRAQGVAHPVKNCDQAKTAERALWASLTSSADGLIDRLFNRPCGRPLSKILVHTPVTPNMVSVASILIGLVSAFFFAKGTHQAVIIGAILFQISAIIDCVDGEIARAVFKESPLGKWIDLVGDQIVHVSVFAGIALGVAKNTAAPEVLWLGASAVAGALVSFAIILRGMRSPAGPGSRPQRLIDAATNRDFSVLVLILALLQKLHLFLWMAAIGSHIFWITALALQLKRPTAGESRDGLASRI